MCPPNPELKLAALNISIRDSWSDEELVRFLAERKAEDPLPQDVLVGLDFSLVDPRIFTGEYPAYAQDANRIMPFVLQCYLPYETHGVLL
jgi:hypothetical protein